MNYADDARSHPISSYNIVQLCSEYAEPCALSSKFTAQRGTMNTHNKRMGQQTIAPGAIS